MVILLIVLYASLTEETRFYYSGLNKTISARTMAARRLLFPVESRSVCYAS